MYEGIKEAIKQKRFFSTTGDYLRLRAGSRYVRKLRKNGKAAIDGKKVLFITFRGGYDCNCKWICNELARQNKYNLVWVYKKDSVTGYEDYPEGVTLTRWGSRECFRHMCTARIIVDNGVSTASLHYKKTEEQILIETWHGSLGIKKFSPEYMKNKIWVESAYKEAEMTDYLISNSTFENDIYREDYWKDSEILTLGHARNDVLFYGKNNPDEYNRIKKKIYSRYGLESDTRICLYGPTFREITGTSQFELPYGNVIKALEKRFGGKWAVFTRFHQKSQKRMKAVPLPEGVVNASDYPDIQELAAVCECGITDYSSWITEYIHTKRPGFIFARDLSEYEKNSRALFFSLSDLPFPLAENGKELEQRILDFDENEFARKWDRFMSDKGCVDDGHASERIATAIIKQLI